MWSYTPENQQLIGGYTSGQLSASWHSFLTNHLSLHSCPKFMVRMASSQMTEFSLHLNTAREGKKTRTEKQVTPKASKESTVGWW